MDGTFSATGEGGQLLLARYRLVARTGGDGVVDVYEAIDQQLGRQVAVKMVNPSYAGDPAVAARLREEARTSSQLEHLAVVRLFDYGNVGGDPFLVTEFVPGKTLESLFRSQEALPVTTAVWIADDVLAGLEHAHQRGVAHGNLGPEDVLLTPQGSAKLTGFGGYSRDAVRSPASAARGNEVGGGAEPPKGPVSPTEDVYAVGLLLFRTLTGQLPFGGNANAARGAGTRVVAPSSLRPGIPQWLDVVVLRALAHDPTKRFGSASEMRNAFVGLGPTPRGHVVGAGAVEDRSRSHLASILPTLAFPHRLPSVQTVATLLAVVTVLVAFLLPGAAAAPQRAAAALRLPSQSVLGSMPSEAPAAIAGAPSPVPTMEPTTVPSPVPTSMAVLPGQTAATAAPTPSSEPVLDMAAGARSRQATAAGPSPAAPAASAPMVAATSAPPTAAPTPVPLTSVPTAAPAAAEPTAVPRTAGRSAPATTPVPATPAERDRTPRAPQTRPNVESGRISGEGPAAQTGELRGGSSGQARNPGRGNGRGRD